MVGDSFIGFLVLVLLEQQSSKEWFMTARWPFLLGLILGVQTQAQVDVDFDDLVEEEIAKIYRNSSASGAPRDQNSSSSGVSISISNYAASQQKSAQWNEASLESSQTLPTESNVVDPNDSVIQEVDSIRRGRKSLERQTDIRALEVIEKDRVRAEQRRLGKIQGSLVDNDEETGVSSSRSKVDRKALKEEIKSELSQEMALYSTVSDADLEQRDRNDRVQFLVGVGDYSDVRNVRGNYVVGVQYSIQTRPSWLADFGFHFAEFDVEQRDGGWVLEPGFGWVLYPRITKMNQYQFSVGGRFSPLQGVFRPYAGGLAAYTFRTFSDVQFALPNNDAQSHAFDLGLVAGIDFELTQDFSLGFNSRFMVNITHRANNSGLQRRFSQSVYRSDRPIESVNYTIMGITGEFRF